MLSKAEGTTPSTRLPASSPADGRNDGKTSCVGLSHFHMLCILEVFFFSSHQSPAIALMN